MSLSGTLETFALPDVLALLAATKKTGELQVDGGRGEARLWLDNGEMVGADVPRATTFVDALFEMLRLSSGNFAFDNDGRPASPGDPQPIEPLLLEAKSRLGEWKSIEAVVPSLACAVKLAAEVSDAEVRVTAEQWRTLVAVAMSRDVEGVVRSLELGEFASCRMLKDLVQIGLVSVEDAPSPAAEAPKPAPATATAPEADAAVVVDASPDQEPPAGTEASRPAVRRIGGSAVAAGSSQGPDADAGAGPDKPAPAPQPAAAAPAVAASAGPDKPAPVPAPQPAAAAPAVAASAGPRSAGIDNADAIPREVPHLRSNRPAAPAAATTSPDQPKAGLRPAASADTAPKPVERRPANPDASDLVHQLAELQGGDRRPTPPAPPRPATASPSASPPAAASPGAAAATPPAAASPGAAAPPTPRPAPAQTHADTAAGRDDKAAAAPTEAEDAATDESPETDETKGEEPLNRGLLLKFLNSVRS